MDLYSAHISGGVVNMIEETWMGTVVVVCKLHDEWLR